MRPLPAQDRAPSTRRNPRRGRAHAVMLALSLSPLSLCGCGSLTSSGYSVSGDVTWKGQPLDQGMIQFLPEAKEGAMVGSQISNGHYSLPNPPGLVPGKYRVRINSQSGAGAAAGGIPDAHLADPNSKERIPPEYNEKTTLEAEVTSGGSKTFNFDLKDKGVPATASRAAR